ncbi:MAG: UvrD-helicase domain-containing protein, partial [Thermodesulfobacteriota bacterium]
FVTVPGDFNQVEIQKVYHAYQEILRQRGALDFDDLIFQTVRLLQGNPDTLAFYQDAWRYVLVDEFQDTSHGQYRLVELLARKHRNLCAIGSPAQSIYGWRGAEIKNILENFEKGFPEAKVVVLDQNYRSSKTIVAAAQAVARSMADYQRYRDHALWTANPQGPPIFYRRFASDRDEAAFVSAEIRRLTFWSDPAVRYVVGWLRAAHNPDDPGEMRGAALSDDLGPLLVERLETAGYPLTCDGLAQVLGEADFLDEQEQGMVVAFLDKIDRLGAAAGQGDAGDLVAAIVAERGEAWSEPASQQNLAELRAKAGGESVADFLQGVIPLVESAPRLDDMAVLYRTNAQSRLVERCLLDAGIPYQMGGRSRFFERVEVRDMLSYLRLVQNPEDVEALRGTINRPSRGLGPKTLEKVQGQEPNLSLDLIAQAIANEDLSEKARRALEEYYVLVMDLEQGRDLALPDLLDFLVERTGYREYLLGEVGGRERLENIQELRVMTTR